MKKFLLTGCCLLMVAMAPAGAETLVFLNSLHNLDWAKGACDDVLEKEPYVIKDMREIASMQLPPGLKGHDWSGLLKGANECRSVGNTWELGRKLENELLDALAVNPTAAGLPSCVIRTPIMTQTRPRPTSPTTSSSSRTRTGICFSITAQGTTNMAGRSLSQSQGVYSAAPNMGATCSAKAPRPRSPTKSARS
jgi:hypothetical protein